MRSHYPPEFKSQIVLEVLREGETVNEIAAKHVIHLCWAATLPNPAYLGLLDYHGVQDHAFWIFPSFHRLFIILRLLV